MVRMIRGPLARVSIVPASASEMKEGTEVSHIWYLWGLQWAVERTVE